MATTKKPVPKRRWIKPETLGAKGIYALPRAVYGETAQILIDRL